MDIQHDTSLIITTYNWPQALITVLKSIFKQTVFPLEIIIADDGSTPETKKYIDDFAAQNTQIPIIHSWQEDKGFRLSTSRNKAIAKASGDYIIMIDGDIVCEKHFIEDHIACREKGYFLQGPRVLTNEQLKNKFLQDEKIPCKFFYPGFKKRKNLIRSPFLSQIFSPKSSKPTSIKGCNMSFFRQDCIAINGFEEKFTNWGKEDDEFVDRLLRHGILEKKVRFRALMYHLYHTERDRSEEHKNLALLAECIANKKKRADEGINKYLS